MQQLQLRQRRRIHRELRVRDSQASLQMLQSTNSNTNSLGIGSKNTAAWGIMIDTGAAISLAPVSFAPSTELSPLEGTFQLRSVTGEAIQAYGRRTVELRGSQLSFQVSFVIADVQHALLGMDVFHDTRA